MRYCAAEKGGIIRLVENSSLSVRQTLARLDIHKSTFYNWLKRFQEGGVDGLEDRKPSAGVAWNKIPEDHCKALVEMALDSPELSRGGARGWSFGGGRRLAVRVSRQASSRPHQLPGARAARAARLPGREGADCQFMTLESAS